MKLNHLLINDLRELCQFYIRREDIVQKAPSKYISNDHSKSTAEMPNTGNKRNHFNSNQSYQSEKSSKSVNRNKSFSSYLNQQEAYGLGAFESIQILNNNPKKQGLARNMSTHSLSSFASANQLESSMSYIEKTARKLHPILIELKKRMIPEKRRKKLGNQSSVSAIDDSEDELLIDLAAEA